MIPKGRIKYFVAPVVLAFMLTAQLRPSESAAKVHVSRKFVPRGYEWTGINRIAILPIEPPKTSGSPNRRSTVHRAFPSDSLLNPVRIEMSRRITHLDSSIAVVLVDPLTFDFPESALVKAVGAATKSDAVIQIQVTRIYYNDATPTVPGPFIAGTPLPPMGGSPASTQVKMKFTMYDAREGSVIWEIETDGRESAGGIAGSPDEAEAPGPEALMRELTIVAASWLPF